MATGKAVTRYRLDDRMERISAVLSGAGWMTATEVQRRLDAAPPREQHSNVTYALRCLIEDGEAERRTVVNPQNGRPMAVYRKFSQQ